MGEAELLPAKMLLRMCLRAAEPRSLTLVCTCVLTTVADLIRSDSEFLASKLRCLGTLGGVRREAGRWVPDEKAPTNCADIVAAREVVAFCLDQQV